MKNLLAAGFLFVGGAILMTVSELGKIVPFLGAACAMIGAGMLIYVVFSNNGKYDS